MPQSGPAEEHETAPVRGQAAPGLEVSDFLLHTCHDLRASVRAIRVHAELLAKERADGEAINFAEHLTGIVADTGRLELLANGLSGYSIACQIDPASFVVAPAEVMLRTALSRITDELKANGAEVTYDALPRVRCDPDRIQQLFENLVRNALLHSGAETPRIHVSAEQQGGDWALSVHDNGPGIESEYLARIFRPFERLRGKQAPGPGLGLTICREIVAKHGGRMWAESEPGNGTTFFFTLPERLQLHASETAVGDEPTL